MLSFMKSRGWDTDIDLSLIDYFLSLGIDYLTLSPGTMESNNIVHVLRVDSNEGISHPNGGALGGSGVVNKSGVRFIFRVMLLI